MGLNAVWRQQKESPPFNYEGKLAASTTDHCILSATPSKQQREAEPQHTCEIPPCGIHLPIIESGVCFILVHLSNGGYQLLFPLQSSKPGSKGDDIIPRFPESHGAHRSIWKQGEIEKCNMLWRDISFLPTLDVQTELSETTGKRNYLSINKIDV